MADITVADLPNKPELLDSDQLVVDDGAESYRVSYAQLTNACKQTGGLADTDLANLTETGEAKFNAKADTDLANVSETGRSTAVGWAMPSDKYIDLTLGASGTTYVAPANGFVFWRKRAAAQFQYIVLVKFLSNGGAYEADVMWSVNSATDLYVGAELRKGEAFVANYTASGTTNVDYFKFIYAEGSKSEAN